MKNLFTKGIEILFCILIFFLIHYIQYQDIYSVFIWISNNISLVILEVILIYLICMLFVGISSSKKFSYIITSIFFILISLISHFKYTIVGEPLTVTDIKMVKNIKDIVGFCDTKVFYNFRLLGTLIIYILSIVLLVKIDVKKILDIKKRIIMIIIPIFTISILFINSFSIKNILPFFGLDVSMKYNSQTLYEEKGVVLGLYADTVQRKNEQPTGYTKEKIFSILDNVKINNEKNEELKPNVVVIMSEAFFDPTKIESINYKEDPIKNIREYLSKYTSGIAISPTFGGGTANVEFEVFTGNSNFFLPYGVSPFNDLKKNFKREIPSIQREFKNNGYKTVAIHTYKEEFYQRNEIYPLIGFDEFISDNDIVNPKYRGEYISDETLTDEIIKQLEKKESPVFVYGLSMQNHAPYTPKTQDDDLISESNLTANVEKEFNSYVNGLVDTDKATKRLIDYIENSGVPTVVLFYGDHLPAQIELYYESKFVSTNKTQEWTKEDLYKTHSIPFFIYDNYKESYSQEYEMGMNFIGNFLCNYVGIEKSLYFRFLDSLKFRAMRSRVFIDENGKIYDKYIPKYKKEIEEYELLQYDILFGENYIKEYYNKQ